MIALISALAVHLAAFPSSATCPADSYLATGIRPSGEHRCYQRVPLEQWPARDLPMGAYTEGRIHCGKGVAVVVSERRVRCASR